MVTKQNIQIYSDTKEKLDSLKLSKSETYNEVISRLLSNYDISDRLGFELSNGIFKLECEADDDHWYFIDELGNTSEVLYATEHFVDSGIQHEYEAFIHAIQEVSQGDLNLLDYSVDLLVGDVVRLDGFVMRRTY